MAEDQDPADAGTESPKGARAIKDRNQRIREEAAAKRRGRREGESRRAAVQRNLDAGEMVDDALARGTHAATGFLKRNLNLIQWAIVAVAAGGIGWQIYTWRAHRTDAKLTDTLMTGVEAEFGRVGEGDAEPDPQVGLTDPRPHYPDDGARLKAAETAYRAASGTETIRSLGQLALAGALYDAGKYKESLAAYQAVRQSKLAQSDTDVRGRSLEGAGLAQEALGEKDAARKSFRELGNSDSAAFAGLGLYHEARVALAGGERDPAKELLKKALDKLKKPDSPDARPTFTGMMARELLMKLDPNAVPALLDPGAGLEAQMKALGKQPGQAAGLNNLSKEKLDELIKKLKETAPPAGAPSGAPAASGQP